MKQVVVSVLLLSLVTAGCGDDDSASDTQAFCDFMARGHETGAPPDADAFEKLEELAPVEVRDVVGVAADIFREKGSDAFDDPRFQQMEIVIEDWEAENCPSTGDSD